MSDSDDNLTQHNMFENENTILRGQSSFFNQNFNSGYSLNHRSMHPMNKRETSPMSLRSVPDFGHNFENSYYSRGRACESVLNGRSQSPGSIGSMDSTTSAVYVAQIFKNMKFSKYDKKIIHEAYNKYFRNRDRRRVGKRRKLKLFMKRNQRKSDDSGDDGSNSSISSDDNRSIRSAIPKESIFRHSNRSNRSEILNFRRTMKKSGMYTDCTESIRNSSLKNIFNDNYVKPTLQSTSNSRDTRDSCSAMSVLPPKNNFKSNIGIQRDRFTKCFTMPLERFNRSVIKPPASRSMLPTNLQNNPRSDDSDSENVDIIPNQTVVSVNNTESRKRTLENNDSTILSIEKRNKISCDIPSTNTEDTTFKKPLLPVRRPIKSKPNFLSGPIASKSKYPLLGFLSLSMTKDRDNMLNSTNKCNGTIAETSPVQTWLESNQTQIDSDSDDMFSTNTLTNINKQQKPNKKDKNDNKISPQNKSKRGKTLNSYKKKGQKNSPDKSPQAKKSKAALENATEEVLISKSKQPLMGNVEVINSVTSSEAVSLKQGNTEKDVPNENTSDNPLSVTEMSMKPSFIKRKLFTQKLDIADVKNASIDSLAANSPRPSTYKLREKNKVRKLATSQSCLSRDIAGGENNNILDLIHKIVPANQMNMTSATNQKSRNSQENDDRWDVTSVISMCNKTNESDTFTDEDIFQVNNATKNNNKTQKNQPCKKIYEKHNIDIDKKEKNNKQEPSEANDYTNNLTSNCTNKRTVSRCVNAYWDTDFETDLEDNMRLPMRSPAKSFGRHQEIEAKHKGNMQKNNMAVPKPSTEQLVNEYNVVLSRERSDIKSNKMTNLLEKKGDAVRKASPKEQSQSIDTKEVNEKRGHSSKKDKCKETKDGNIPKKDNKQNKVMKMSEKKGECPKKGKHAGIKEVKNVNKDKESKATTLSEKKDESVKKGSSPKTDKQDNKENRRRNKSKDIQQPVTEKVKNGIKKRQSPSTPKVEIKSVNKKGNTILNKNESNKQMRSNTKILQENKIIGTIRTRKQKSFLNESSNSICERSIFTRSFSLQHKQRLL